MLVLVCYIPVPAPLNVVVLEKPWHPPLLVLQTSLQKLKIAQIKISTAHKAMTAPCVSTVELVQTATVQSVPMSCQPMKSKKFWTNTTN